MKRMNLLFRRANISAAGLCVGMYLSGCSLAPGVEKLEMAAGAAVSSVLSDRKSYNDKKAETLLMLPCDISIGAFYRLINSVQQEALTMLCSGRRVGAMQPQLNANASVGSQ